MADFSNVTAGNEGEFNGISHFAGRRLGAPVFSLLSRGPQDPQKFAAASTPLSRGATGLKLAANILYAILMHS